MHSTISPFAPAEAPERDLRACYDMYAASVALDFPGTPVASYASYAEQVCKPTSYMGPRSMWVAREDDRVAGTATATYHETENREMASVVVRVRPDLRRRGVETSLLRAILPDLRAHGRDTLVGAGLRVGGAGDEWTRTLGFVRTQERAWQSLTIGDVDPGLWRVPAPEGFRIEKWIDRAPEPLVAGLARARTAIADAPRGASSYVPPAWTVARVREREDAMARIGEEHRLVVAVHEQSGVVAGLTEIAIEPNQPNFCYQEDTAVLADFRGQGLGRFIKAAMMRWLTADRPSIERVLTTTEASNAHMIRVNHQIGYVTDNVVIGVEAGIDDVEACLADSRKSQ
jgi:GNAT superfamily N-acetyltransferase